MIRSSRASPRLSRGERLRLAALALGGVAGAVLCLASVHALDGAGAAGAAGPGRALWRALAGFLGTAGVLWLNRGRFGWPGPGGWLAAAGGVARVTVLAPVAVGTLVLPLYGTMFGPLALAVTCLERPELALLWFGALVAAHRLCGPHRAERATIFRPRPGG